MSAKAGRPQQFPEKKIRVSLTLTPLFVETVDKLGEEVGVDRSLLIEELGWRGLTVFKSRVGKTLEFIDRKVRQKKSEVTKGDS